MPIPRSIIQSAPSSIPVIVTVGSVATVIAAARIAECRRPGAVVSRGHCRQPGCRLCVELDVKDSID